MIFGVVVWKIVISIGKPLSEISSEKKKIIKGILIFMFLIILLLTGIEMYFGYLKLFYKMQYFKETI